MNILINPHASFSFGGLFQTDGDWIHPKKVERTYEIIYVTSGEVYMCEEAKEGLRHIHAKKGELFILSPHCCHYGTKVTTGVSFFWIHFTLKEGGLPFEERFFNAFENAYLFKELLHWSNIPERPDYLVNAVLIHILSELCRAAEHGASGRTDARCEKIYEWIRVNADATLTVERVARHFGYSADHVTRICKQYFKINAKRLINKLTLDRAKTLLSNTDKYVKEIAAELKFSSDKAFVAYFQYHEAASPTEFRNRYGRIHINNK